MIDKTTWRKDAVGRTGAAMILRGTIFTVVIARKALLTSAVLLLCLSPARAGSGAGGILFVSSFTSTIPWTDGMVDALTDELKTEAQPPNLYVEFLDRARLRDSPSDAEWTAFLARKYAKDRPAVIIADGAPAIELIAAAGPQLFGPVPVIGIFPNFDDLSEAARRTVTVEVTTGPHVDRTVGMALDQWPQARRLVVVSDDSEPSRHLGRIIEAAAARRTDRKVAVERLADYRIEDLETTLAALPKDSVVLYTHLSVDALGRQFRPREVASRVAASSAVPVYALFDTDIGTGVVGGSVNSAPLAGAIAMKAALAIVDGVWHPARAGEQQSYSSGPVFDWRQLRRWGLSERALPADAEIRHRQPSLFEQYYAEAMTALAAIALLSLLLAVITILYLQRGHLTAALREANRDLEQRVADRTREIERALSGEQAARRRLRTFLDMAAHELKTPLSVIDSAAQMLEVLVDTGQDGVGRRLSLIRRSARRVIDLIETCLAGERIDDELPVRPAPFSPPELIDRVAERQRGHGGTILVGDTTGLPERWTADPDLLGIALDALLDNARRYGPADGVVDLAADRDGDCLVLSVADRGPGVPPEERERIFDKYFRGENGRAVSGTGIGLNLVKTIAELHGGTVAYTPRPGGGALFTLRIPQAEGEQGAAAR
ncbi:sensor histidine kinase [Azospirillum sp. TSO35-2]|uniref:sensor histidine kinase n=1 Tax=Azospirillum sp. TSO35-2 TaxID=716796 RepID=UPI000D65EBC1|nr:sensor histidine kinase [Azospirillum sp. TSO35-2]